ncbi:MAG TPA: EamA family transporter [Candidatus Solibacter sp.]|nr:EamA family transporter [Candidatus Solibacter sp.]
MSRRGLALFVLMGVVWGIPYLLIKVAVSELSPPTLVLLRTAVGAAILLPIALRRGDLAPLRRHWRAVAVYTVVEVAVPWLLLSHAETRLSSSLSGLMVAMVPLVGVVLTWMLGSGDRLDGRALVGLLIGLFGVGLLVGLDVSVRDVSAVGEIVLVTIGYAIGPQIISRRLSSVPAMGVVTASLVLTAVLYAPAGILLAPPTAPGLAVLASVTALGVVCTAIAFLGFFALIAEIGPVRATVITYINPAVAFLLGVVLLREPFTVGAGLGFLLILAGSVLTTRRPGAGGLPVVAEP